MTTFWIVTAVLAIVVSATLGMALLRGRRPEGDAGDYDLRVYRDQLREIARDAERGVIAPEEAERLRTEVSRRILAADASAGGAASDAGRQPARLGAVAAAVMAPALIGGGYGLYLQLGAPGYGDLALADRKAAAEQARETRPTQAAAEQQAGPGTPAADASPDYLDLVTKLRTAVQERPDDLQGQVLLARSEAALGNYVAAYEAQENIVRIKGDEATARDYADLADMMILAAGGYVSPEAERVLEAALTRDPQNGVARYYGGLMWAQTGRPDAAFRLWEPLLRDSAPTDPWVPPIRAQIEEMAYRAGVQNFSLPPLEDGPAQTGPALPGPSAGDMEAAQDMSPEARQEMIRGMVARLSDRLATEGGSPEEWARLIAAYAVLGNEGQAIAIWDDAKEVFAGNDEALETVREGARNAGLVQ
ncbi:c-type cytochrome biogenesis protein CcmI [Thalassococcus profundi]|uniref:c-type cytochrome biogenesis protein CcmI n=1 Tax=Thalassococcus profundi TaxID=2282382 RepID=UPI004059F448